MKGCIDCKHCDLIEQICQNGMWERFEEDEEYIFDEHNYREYIRRPRFCSEREDLKPPNN